MKLAIRTLAFLLMAAVLAGLFWLGRERPLGPDGENQPRIAAPPLPDTEPPGLRGVPRTSYRAAAAAWKEAEYGEAAMLFGRAVAGSPQDPELRFLLGTSYLLEGLPEPARLQLRRAVASAPGNGKYAYYLGEAEALAGDRPAALAAFSLSEKAGGPFGEASASARKRRGW